MERKSESEVLEEILRRDIITDFLTEPEMIAALDAFIQFSQNPTPMSYGYGIEENHPAISQNLAARYSIERAKIQKITNYLKESITRMREINAEIYFWREAVRDYIKHNYTQKFLQWYDATYKILSSEEKTEFLFFLNALKVTGYAIDFCKWFSCFFDKEEKYSENEIKELLVKLGIGNLLRYVTSSTYSRDELIPNFFLTQLHEKFKQEIPIQEKQVEEYFNNSPLSDIKLLEMCAKKTTPVLESRIGKVFLTSPLIVEKSKSYFAISPFALNKLRELIKSKKLELTLEWKQKLDKALNALLKEAFPLAELKIIFEIEGGYCWGIKYTDSPEKEPINAGVFLAPYIFPTSEYRTILDEMKAVTYTQLNLIFLTMETLPTIAESFQYVTQKNLIFLLDERKEKFYLIERSEKIPEDKALMVDSFLSRFMSIIEKQLQVSRTWPSQLKDYVENLKYLNKFPRLFAIQNRTRAVQPKLRNTTREKFEKNYGDKWKDVVKEKLPTIVDKTGKVAQARLDKEEVKDFLDGATLGELLDILRSFSDSFSIEKKELDNLEIITKHRKVLEHPLRDQESDIDEKTYNKLQIALEYIERIICS